MKKFIWVIVAVVVIVGVGWWYEAHAPAKNDKVVPPTENAANTTGTELGAGDFPAEGVLAKEISLSAKNYSYDTKEIRVKKGETVKLIFFVTEGFHDVVIDEFGVRTKRLNAGQNETVTFTPDKAGTFAYYCSVGSHRAMGMEGKIVVE